MTMPLAAKSQLQSSRFAGYQTLSASRVRLSTSSAQLRHRTRHFAGPARASVVTQRETGVGELRADFVE